MNIIRKIIFYFFCKKNKIIINNANVSSNAKIGTNVQIGEHTYIDKNCDVGSYTYLGRNCNVSKTTIGRYCSIANNVSIGQGEHDIDEVSTSSYFYDNAYERLTQEDCIIENDVWIGTDCIILRGVKISTGAIIGANSVVTKDVPPYAIVVGSPAKILRYRFDENKINKLLISKWWKLNLNDAKDFIKSFNNEK